VERAVPGRAGDGHAKHRPHAAAQQDCERRQVRRLRAAELFAIGVSQAQLAARSASPNKAVSVWQARLEAGRHRCAAVQGPTGPTSKDVRRPARRGSKPPRWRALTPTGSPEVSCYGGVQEGADDQRWRGDQPIVILTDRQYAIDCIDHLPVEP
jgi:hypothetical protein